MAPPDPAPPSPATGERAGLIDLFAFMDRARSGLRGLGRGRRWASAFGFGALAALALPPVHAVPVLFVSFTALMWLIEDAPGWRAAAVSGWWFGFGHGAIGLYWIGVAFTVDAATYGWMAPLAVAGIAAWMGVFAALAAAVARALHDRVGFRPPGRVLVFAALWVIGEGLRGALLTGFPWNLLGTVWTFSDAMIQLAALTGVHGLSLLTVIAAAMPATLAPGPEEAPEKGADAAAPRAGRGRASVLALVALALVWGGGALRLAGAEAGTVEGVRLRLVQPNIPQALKWRPDLRRGHVVRQIAMSTRAPAAGTQAPTHVIWAETSVPYAISRVPGLAAALGRAAPERGAVIVGAPRRNEAGATADGDGRVWNSLQVIEPDGRVAQVYDKFHLVPFGEYVPLRAILPIGKLTAGRHDFAAGPGLRTLEAPGLPAFSALICYEVIFSGRVTDATGRARWLLNMTNDAWFGATSGPYQHFAAARLRAVEEGLAMIRVANTGISGIVDPFGRVISRAGLGVEAVIDGPLPRALDGPTVFSRFGRGLATVMIVIVFAMAGVLIRR